MKILKGNYGECRFCDNMDEQYGLPSLKEKSWDLCLTDPPYNIDAKGGSGYNKSKTNQRGHVKQYKDMINHYYDWCDVWSKEIERIAFSGFIFVGFSNIGYWTWVKKMGYIIWFRRNSGHRAFNSFFNLQEPIITFGKTPRKIQGDVLDVYIKNGFLREGKWDHPHPKPERLFQILVEESEVKTVIDPFLGSGTTAEVCESLGIPWLGYEIMEEYAPDIEKRIKRGIKKKKQESLEAFL